MMPTFPSSSLEFRTAGFPRYGFKAGISDRACPDDTAHASLGLPPSFALPAAYVASPFYAGGRATAQQSQSGKRRSLELEVKSRAQPPSSGDCD